MVGAYRMVFCFRNKVSVGLDKFESYAAAIQAGSEYGIRNFDAMYVESETYKGYEILKLNESVFRINQENDDYRSLKDAMATINRRLGQAKRADRKRG